MQYLFKANCAKQPGTAAESKLKLGQVNEKLDELVAAKADQKQRILQFFLQNTSPRLMKRIVSIILKDTKVHFRHAL